MRRNLKNGFTLMEMLIVIAIIAVLIAIATPIFTHLIKRSRAAVDAANVRSAKAAAAAEFMLDDTLSKDGTATYYYDGTRAYLLDGSVPGGVKGYGLSKEDLTADNILDDFAEGIPDGQIVLVSISPNGEITASWGEGSGSSGYEGDYIHFEQFCDGLQALEEMGSTNHGSNKKTNLIPGSTFTYKNVQYIFNDHYVDILPKGDALDKFVTDRLSSGLMFTPASTIYSDATKAPGSIQKGALWQVEDTFYVAVTEISDPADTSVNDNSWVQVSLPKTN